MLKSMLDRNRFGESPLENDEPVETTSDTIVSHGHMSSKSRILIADDSATIRATLAKDAVFADGGIEMV